jgi:hypothetical protein
MFHKQNDLSIAIGALLRYVPMWMGIILQKITIRAAKRFSEYQTVSNNIALEIVRRETASLEGGLPQGKDIMSSLCEFYMHKEITLSSNCLTVRANMSETAKNKMSTEELLSQMRFNLS